MLYANKNKMHKRF